MTVEAPPAEATPPREATGGNTEATVVEVLPDVSGIDRVFHYLVPASMAEHLVVGTIVRVGLHGRRVRGFVLSLGAEVPEGVTPRPIAGVLSVGPPAELVALCRWGSWRYAGRLRPFLKAASPPGLIRRLPSRPPAALGWRAVRPGLLPPVGPSWSGAIVDEALSTSDAVIRLPPAAERLPLVLALLEATAARPGDPLVLVESHADARALARRLAVRGVEVCLYPEQWALAAGGGRTVIGTRNVAFAPGRRSVVVVLDAHSESYRSERAPTFDARVLAAERGRREGAPVVYLTACPSLELLEGRALVTVGTSAERNGWPSLIVLDTREEDPREGGYPGTLVALLRRRLSEGAGPGRPVVLVLNQKGRARLLACGRCRSVQRCDRCGSAVAQAGRPPAGHVGELLCPRCGERKPALCANCGGARLRVLRPGVSLARDQLAAVLGTDVAEMGRPGSPAPVASVIVGTEAVLHAVRTADTVVFLDLDHELLAPRFRAVEQALVLLARAARLVGPRAGDGRLVVRTSMPEHEVVRAAREGDPGILSTAEAARRGLLQLPPFSSLASLSGPEAASVAGRLQGVEVSPGGRSGFLVRAPGPAELADAFARLVGEEEAGWAGIDARVEMDPLDV